MGSLDNNLSGDDWGGKFMGITKKKWVGAYMKLDKMTLLSTASGSLVKGLILTELVNGALPL